MTSTETNIVLTAAQTELQAHLKAEGERVRAWVAEDPANRWAGYPACDSRYMAQLESEGIMTVEQYERQSLADTYYDMYKDVHGISPRWMNLNDMSVEELREAMDRLSAEAEEQYEFNKAQNEAWEARREHEELLMKVWDEEHEEDLTFQTVAGLDEYDPAFYGLVTRTLPGRHTIHPNG